MNTQGYFVPLDVDVEQGIKHLNEFEKKIGVQEDALNRLGRTDPYSGLSGNISNFNRKLADGTRIYQQIEKSAKSYKAEIDRLTAAEKELMTASINAKNALDYDEAQRNLAATRNRIQEIRDGLNGLEDRAGRAGKKLSGIGGLLQKGVGLVAGFFAVDTLIDAEEKIISIEGEYEKYSSVLTNAFQSERLAADGMKLISDLAAKTPFQVNELTESYVKLVNRGFVPTREELIKQGDLAATTGKSFDQLSEAILDSVTGENERLKEFGIRATQTGDTVTFAFKGIEKQVKKTDQEGIRQAILSFGELKGVAGAMAGVSEKLNGQLSNTADVFEQIFKNLGERESGLLNSIVGGFGKFLGYIKDITEISPVTALQQQQAAFNSLAGAVLLSNEKSEVHKTLMSELIRQYPSLNQLIDAETANNEDLARAMVLVNDQYRTRIELAAQDVLARRNAEKVADAMERQRDALKQTADAYRDYLISSGKSDAQATQEIANFNRLTDAQKKATLSRVKDAEERKLQASGQSRVNSGPNASAGALSGDQIQGVNRINAINSLTQAENSLNQAVEDGNAIETDRATILAKQSNERLEAVQRAQKELDVLNAKQKTEKLTTEELHKQAALQKFVKGAATYGDAATTTITPGKPGPDKKGAAEAARLAEELRRLLKQQLADEEKYQLSIQKIDLESDNIRLSQLGKFSDEYLTAKRAYDQKVLEQERQNQVAIYAESIKNVVKFKDAAGKMQQELRSLLDETTAKFKGQGQSAVEARNSAIAEIDKNRFSKDPNTKPVRDLLDLRADVNTQNNNRDEQTRNDQLNKARTDQLGAGFDKEKAVIAAKYKELYELYKGNEELIGELRKKEALEQQQAVLSKDQQTADKRAQNVRTLSELAVKQQGETETDFQLRKQKTLLENEEKYYQDSLKALTDYLATEIYLRSVADGKVSKEEKEQNDKQVEILKAQLALSSKNLEDFTKTSKLTANKYSDVWELMTAGAAKFFGKDSGLTKFFNDPVNKEAATKFYTALKSAAQEYFDAEIKLSQARISQLDTEINDKSSAVDAENEKRKEGLANNYATLKKDLDATKQTREDEKEHLKKIQKEKAIIDSAEVASTTAVAVANLYAAMAKAVEGVSGIPFAGIAIGLALAATLFAGIISIKSKLKAASQLRKGKRLDGASHENGGLDIVDPKTGEVKYSGEGGEWLVGSKPSAEHNEFIGHMNADTFKDLPSSDQERMMKKLGVRFSRLDASFGKAKVLAQKVNSSQQAQDLRALERLMGKIDDNTARIPEFEKIPLADGRVARYKDDNLVGYDNHEKS